MKSNLKVFALVLFALGMMGASGYAQTNAITDTSLAAAVTSTATTILVSSATGITADPQTMLMIDQEPMAVIKVSGTTITVSRTTTKAAHVIYSRVYIGRPDWFMSYDPPAKTSCTLASIHSHPWVNINNGNVWSCVSSLWVLENELKGSTGRAQAWTVPLGSVAYGSMGTNSAVVATTMYVADIEVPRTMPLNGVKVLAGGTVGGSDKGIAFLYKAGGGDPVAYSLLAGTTFTGTDTLQTLAFTTPYMANGPGKYFIGIQMNCTTTTLLRLITTSTFVNNLTTTKTGVTFGTLPRLTAPTTFTADVGPIAGVY